jgi:polysaccharide biosynthesis protein PslH
MNPSPPNEAKTLSDAANHQSILMLTYISPMQKWGSAKRSRFLIDALKRHGEVEVLVLTFVDAAGSREPMTVVEWQGIKVMDLQIVQRGLRVRPRFDVMSPYVTREVARHLDLSRYDLLVSRYVRPAMKLKLPEGVPLLVDFDDAVYEPPWRALHTVKSWVGVVTRLLNDRVILRGRLRQSAWLRAHFLFCRDAERNEFDWLRGSVLPNLPPTPDREGPPDFTPPQQPALMFIGLLDYMPNHDAVDWFIEVIWPMVLKQVPQARFLIVGSGAESRLARWRRAPRVETLGFVDSLAQAYHQATACVVPMRSGAGTNIKALEPYLYGRMVIATPLVVEGHSPLFTPGVDILAAADAAGLAVHCVNMLRAPQRAGEMARLGYQRITSSLTEDRFRSIVDDAVASLRPEALDTGAGPGHPGLAEEPRSTRLANP